MASILGTGRHLPERVLANDAFAETAGVSPAWIEKRTGIRERRVVAPGEGTASMGGRAGAAALHAAGVEAAELGLIIVATSTPDHLTPPAACEVQAELGAHRAACFDIEAGFAGWLYALITAGALIESGAAGTALVIGAETLSTVTDRSDPSTGPLFGDGAGAAVLTLGEGPLAMRSSSWWADGRLASSLLRPSGGSRRPFDLRVLEERSHLLRMEGTKLFRQAVRTMAAQAETALERAGIGWDEIGLVVPHQANRRIIEALGRELDLPEGKVFINIDRYGNTGAATIPIALDEAIEQQRVTGVAKVLLVSFGAGATAGAVVLSGGAPPA